MPKWVFDNPSDNTVAPTPTPVDTGGQPAGDYATVAQLATKQDKGDYALTTQLDLKQDKGDYALAVQLDLKQDKGDYATNDALQGKQDKGDYATTQDLVSGLASKQPTGSYAQASDVAAYTLQTDTTLSSMGSRLDSHDTQLSNVISVNTAQTSTMNSHETRITNNETKLAGLGSLSTKNSLSYSELTNPPTLGTLAAKNQADYNLDLTNKPTLGTLAAKNTVSLATDVTGQLPGTNLAPSIAGSGLSFTNGVLASTVAASVSTPMFRNMLINGDFAIGQGTTAGTQYISPNSTVDRWSLVSSTPVYNSRYVGGAFPVSGGVAAWNIYSGGTLPTASVVTKAAQIIEQQNMAHLQWNNGNGVPSAVTLSFVLYSGQTGTFHVALRNGNPANGASYVIPFTCSTPAAYVTYKATIPAPSASFITNPTDTGPGLEVAFIFNGSGSAAANITATPNQWIYGTYPGPVMTSAQSNWMTTSSNLFLVQVQLERGSTATPFEYRFRATELQLCQRYLARFANDMGSGANQCFGMGVMVLNNHADFSIPLLVPMRDNTSVVCTASATATWNVLGVPGYASGTVSSSPGLSGTYSNKMMGPSVMIVYVPISNTLTQATPCYLVAAYSSTTGSTWIAFSCEFTPLVTA